MAGSLSAAQAAVRGVSSEQPTEPSSASDLGMFHGHRLSMAVTEGPAGITGQREASVRQSRDDPADLSWLTPQLNAARRELATRLKGARRTHSGSWPGPSAPFVYLSEIERDIRRADALIEGVRTKLLSNEEWRELETLVQYYRESMPGLGRTLQEMLQRNDALSAEDAGLLRELLKRLVETHGYLASDPLPWDAVSEPLALVPGRAADNQGAVVTSRVIPGSAFRAHIAGCCPDDAGADPPARGRRDPVPGLMLTTLVDAKDQTLFTGLRHGFIHAQRARGTSSELESTREQACRELATITAAAALVANPVKFQSALEGTTVDLGLTSISLVTRDDLARWEDQFRAFADLERMSPIALAVRNPQGEPRTVMANVRVRQFAFSANEERLDGERPYENYRRYLPETLERLFGPSDSLNPAGDVKRSVDEINAHLRESLREIEEEKRGLDRKIAEGGREAVRALLRQPELEARIHKRNADSGKVRALQEAATQAKSMVAHASGSPAGVEGLYEAAARIAMVSYFMGEMPLLSCTNGRNFTHRLDSEIKRLVAIAGAGQGARPQALRSP